MASDMWLISMNLITEDEDRTPLEQDLAKFSKGLIQAGEDCPAVREYLLQQAKVTDDAS